MPTWDELPERIQQAWSAATIAGVEAMLPPQARHPEGVSNRASKEEKEAHMQRVRDFWLPIIKPGGQLDEHQILLELSDYSHLMREAPKVYMGVTNDRMSYTTYLAEDILRVAGDVATEERDEALLELLLDLYDTFEGDEDRALLQDTARRFGILDLKKEFELEDERQKQTRQLLADHPKAQPLT